MELGRQKVHLCHRDPLKLEAPLNSESDCRERDKEGWEEGK